MVAFKAGDVDGFIARPDPAKPIILVFGPDAGLVHERSHALVRSAVKDMSDPFALARIDGDALAEIPERLVEEAHTVPLFAGRRAVWVRAGSKNFARAIELLLAAPPGPDCRIVIEAGDLRKGAPLRTLCERAPVVAALPCYADDGRGLGRLIDEELRGAGLKISPAAKARLQSLIGADRGVSRSEIRKLALYAEGQGTIEIDDVEAVIGDASTSAIEAVVDAAFAGRPAEIEATLVKVRVTGANPNAVAAAVLRHASFLHRLRLTVDAGTPIRAAVENVTPKIHFSRTAAVQTAVAQWSTLRRSRV